MAADAAATVVDAAVATAAGADIRGAQAPVSTGAHMETQTCGYCGAPYLPSENTPQSCRYHPDFYFPYDIDKDGIFTKGWNCCGDTDPSAPGCTVSFHRSDVRKVYYPNSIRYYFEEILPEVERARLERADEIAKLREEQERNPAFQELRTRLLSWKGRSLREFEKEFGEPLHRRRILNGSSGFVSSSYRNYFAADGIHFSVDSDWISTSSKSGYEHYTVESFSFYADLRELDEANARLITDLRG